MKPWSKVAPVVRFNRHWSLDAATGCWVWNGFVRPNGYGHSCYKRKTTMAHRVAWFLYRGPIPDGMVLDHICRNRGCVNPDHLRVVTPGQNATENSLSPWAKNKQKTHCPAGHEYTPENTYRVSTRPGNRVCLTCIRRKSRERYAKKKQKNQGNPHGHL